jgi:DNA gyrase subunit A
VQHFEAVIAVKRRIAGRSTQGVIVFDTAEGEHVVSVGHIGEDAENSNGNGG